jgi:hypothetical protein
MKHLKKFESEVSSGNASGKAGVSSLPFRGGFYKSGNNGEFGTQFTPSEEPSFKTYKSMKHSKKNLKNKKKLMKKFEEFNDQIIEEDPDSFTVGQVIERLKKYNLNDKIYHIISKNDKTGYCAAKPIDDEILEEILDKIFIVVPNK